MNGVYKQRKKQKRSKLNHVNSGFSLNLSKGNIISPHLRKCNSTIPTDNEMGTLPVLSEEAEISDVYNSILLPRNHARGNEEIKVQDRSSSKVLSRRTTVVVPTIHEDASEDFNEELLSREITQSSLVLSTATTRRKRSFIEMPGRVSVFDPEADYDFESDDEKPRAERYASSMEACQGLYRTACKQQNVIPSSKVIKQIGQTVICLRDYCLSCDELKAIFMALSNDTELTELDLSGNTMTVRAMSYVIEILKSNKGICNLVLDNCKVNGEPLAALAEFLKDCRSLKRLDLSGNNLSDRDSDHVASILEHNESLVELILRRNELGSSGVIIGRALAENVTLTSLDLSWNHIRTYGAIGISKGVQGNGKLVSLNLAWNGFGFEGCSALGHALLHNTNLLDLDLTSNRIHPPALFELLKGLMHNKTLVTLKLSYNPITAPMTGILLSYLLKAKESTLKELDLEGIVVNKEFEEVLKEIQKDRFILVRFGQSLPLNKDPVYKHDPDNIFNIDPIRILYFMKEHLRSIDLFLKFDSDNNSYLTRDELHVAFKRGGYPISDTALDQVMTYLDSNRDDKIDLLEFMEGERKLKRQNIAKRQEQLRSKKDLTEKDLTENSQSFITPQQSKTGMLPKI